MTDKDTEARYNKLKLLIKKYYAFKDNNPIKEMSEEATRVWLNDFLEIFGWDVHNISQVLQEQSISQIQKSKLELIESSHSKPDYTLVNGKIPKTYLDAKKNSINIFQSKDAAFQIRSYGWSAKVPCAFLSNFEQFVIFDCRNMPEKDLPANVGTIQIGINEYLDKFDVLNAHLDRTAVYQGHLEKIYSIHKTEGQKTVDLYFNELLSDFRISLANNIYRCNPKIQLSIEQLNYYVQLIIDRIIFIRVCESKGIEEKELLKTYITEGFWNKFKDSCYTQFYEHYDGALFSVSDNIFKSLAIDDSVFEKFIEKLYYPYPYKFDAIPVQIIAKVYEEFLAYSLVIKNKTIIAELKPEYVKSNGAIPTDVGLAEAICNETFDFSHINSIDELLSLKILDPCCGSGIFLVTAYERLSNAFKILASEESGYYLNSQSEKYLTLDTKRKIMHKCLYGIDIDPTAIEVTKMSLALKIIDDTIPELYSESGMFGEKILKDIHDNIICGNTLVDGNIDISASEIIEIKPLAIHRQFRHVFSEGGFSYIIGNPPYVETKFFKAFSLTLHQYLRENYDSFEGKADLSVLFMERCLSLLKEKGTLGVIIQRRWFKTSYGKKARNVIAESGYLKTLLDIGTTNMFHGRINYVSIMVLEKKKSEYVNYDYIPGNDRIDVINYLSENKIRKQIPLSFFQNNIWSPEFYDIEKIKRKYADKIGVLGDNKNVHIRDGIQALWKKIYHITECQEKNKLVFGKNGFGETVCLEKDMVKPLIYNREFLSLKTLQPDAFCLFPYAGADNKQKMPILKIKESYPYTYQYLSQNEERIKAHVKCNQGEFWHTFTREHNHEWFLSKKIIIPMTARDTFATYENSNGLYMDNSNVWFINIDAEEDVELKATTLIINSTVFSVFAKSGANPQSGGYYKFNKQFLTPVPFPNAKMNKENKFTQKLSQLYDKIIAIKAQYDNVSGQNAIHYESVLESYWEEVDTICEDMYELDPPDRNEIRKTGRSLNRTSGAER